MVAGGSGRDHAPRRENSQRATHLNPVQRLPGAASGSVAPHNEPATRVRLGCTRNDAERRLRLAVADDLATFGLVMRTLKRAGLDEFALAWEIAYPPSMADRRRVALRAIAWLAKNRLGPGLAILLTGWVASAVWFLIAALVGIANT